jgi:hypothetical protein
MVFLKVPAVFSFEYLTQLDKMNISQKNAKMVIYFAKRFNITKKCDPLHTLKLHFTSENQTKKLSKMNITCHNLSGLLYSIFHL